VHLRYMIHISPWDATVGLIRVRYPSKRPS
jgi:hypothetical protein